MMGRDDIAFLIVKTATVSDEIGNQQSTTTEKQVFVTVESIGQSEHYAAAQRGFKPDFKLTVSEFDYNGEENIKFHDGLYNIYRTFLRANDERLELYLNREAGTNDAV